MAAQVFQGPGSGSFVAANTAVKYATAGTAIAYGGAFAIPEGAVALGYEGGGAFGAGDLSIAQNSLAYSDKVLAQTDLYHSVPNLFANDIIEGGQVTQGGIGQYGSPYMQYNLPGSINSTPGMFQIGGHWVTQNSLWVVHNVFIPF